MVLDDEKQRKTLMLLVSSVRVQGTMQEAEATITEMRKLLDALRKAKVFDRSGVEKDGNKKRN